MKNLKLFTLAIFAMISMIFVTASMAQTNTTGEVEGTVTDQNGAVVRGVSLTLSGPGLIRDQTTTSDENGNYRFSSVPPGRYNLATAAISGFQPFKQSAVEVSLTKTTTINVTLSTGVSGVVDVVAGQNVDQSANTTGTNISTEFFSNIPTSRTVQGLYTIAPTVARSGLRDASGRDRDPSVAGSSGPENSYILDGVTTTDPAFGGGGANLPFEFVQEVQVKTGSYGADQGLSTGGVFNVITKTGGNQFHGDAFAFFGIKGLVAKTKNFPQTGNAPNGFSEADYGFDIGGPIAKNKLTFFAAINPQHRENNYLTQTFRRPVLNKINTPFYSGKITWQANNNNVINFSTFGDYTTQKGFLGGSGFGANLDSFNGAIQTGGTNYAARWNSNFSSHFLGEFSFGVHRQRANTIPVSSQLGTALVADNFAVLKADGTVANVTSTGVNASNTNIGKVDYVASPGGSLQRGFVRDGFGLFSDQNRNRWETAAKMQYITGKHTVKFGFEFYENKYRLNTISTGPSTIFANPLAVAPANGSNPANVTVSGYRVTNNFSVCTTRGTVITCPSQTAANALISPGVVIPGFTVNPVATPITSAEALRNPFLVRTSTRVRDFKLIGNTKTRVESFYAQDDFKVLPNVQINLGGRWDYQQASGNDGSYLKLNKFWDNFQPRLGLIWDPTKTGKGKFFVNYARYVETPLPLDVNVRAGSNSVQTDKNFNVNTLNAPLTATVATGFGTRNLGSDATPVDPRLKPQTVNEYTAGMEYEFFKGTSFGVRGIYRPQGSVIEDGSFDDGNTYFLFNPGEPLSPSQTGTGIGNTEFISGLPPCAGANDTTNPLFGRTCGGVGAYFGRARRYYRALELTMSRRFANNYSYNASYVWSSLIGNYEGLFRNDNGQSDPNITSLFDLVSLLTNMYGRLPNDRPHQFKFNGSYTTPFKLVLSGNFYAQSGIPFNQLIPHPVYGNNEGFAIQRGTAIIPNLGAISNGVTSAVGKNRTPLTYNLDLGFYYPIVFSESKQLRFTADWFNVTNAQRAVTVDNTFSINSGVAGVAPVLNPFWGAGTVFQYPSALRLGVKFSF